MTGANNNNNNNNNNNRKCSSKVDSVRLVPVPDSDMFSTIKMKGEECVLSSRVNYESQVL